MKDVCSCHKPIIFCQGRLMIPKKIFFLFLLVFKKGFGEPIDLRLRSYMIRAIAHFLPMPCLACQTCLRHVSFCAILAIKIAPPPKTLPQGRRCIIICHDDVRAEGLTAALNDLHAEAKKDQQLAMFVDGRCVWCWGQWGVPSCVEGCSSAMVWINFAAQRGYIYGLH